MLLSAERRQDDYGVRMVRSGLRGLKWKKI
jgi:hypothetical protein